MPRSRPLRSRQLPQVATSPPVPDLVGSDDVVYVHAYLDAHMTRAWEMFWLRRVLGAQENDTGPEAVLGKQLQSPLHQSCL